jgi:acetolactate synthase-1/2/3 large subunit
MKASDLLVKCLEAENVKHIFGVPGEENQDLLFSLEQSEITFVPTRHEQGAAFIADVFGRLTGKAGVCLATLGPGATNLITGVADAHFDKAPLVAITGQGDSDRLHKESHQAVDIPHMFEPITKWNTSIQNPHIINEAVRKAFKLAETEKPGATHLELPEDVAKMEVHQKPITPMRVRRSAPDYKAVDDAITLIKAAKFPLIIAGNGAIRKLASKHLRQFVEKTGIPVAHTFMGKGAISDDDKHSLCTIGLGARDYVMCYVDRADVIITVGYDIGEYPPSKWNPQQDKQIIHIDFTPAEVDHHYSPAVEIVADISASLWELNKRLEQEQIHFNPETVQPLREKILEDHAHYSLKQGDALTVPGTLNILRELMGEEDILISDVGSHKMWIARNFHTKTPGSVIISNGLASMGIALPGGIAAKIAHPERKVVAAMGDGGFLMNMQEIETAKRLGLGYVILVWNDNDYGLIRWKQEAAEGKSFGTTLTNPDYMKLAESFGIKGYKPTTVKGLKENLKEALAKEELCLVAIDIDPSENMKLSRKLDQDWCETFDFKPEEKE